MFSKYGNISAFLVPKSKSVALIDFTEPVHARSAFKGLAYRRYHHTPLYLEWAPLNVVTRQSGEKKGLQKEKMALKAKDETRGEDIAANDSFSTLYVKNLSFGTTEEMIREHVYGHGLIDGIRAISLPKKRQGDKQLSMGYGFIEFKTPSIGETALSRLSNSVLDGRALEFKMSDKRLTESLENTQSSDKLSTKLLVRNVAFQASQKELRALFSTFGTVTRVRIPKKMGGEHRGFAFVDFGSVREAKAAKQALTNTHLYGRHLVIEWANEEETSVEALRKRSQVDMTSIRGEEQKKKQRTDVGDSFNTGDIDII